MVASIGLQILLRLRPYPMRGHRLLCHATSSNAAAHSVCMTWVLSLVCQALE